jgi:hypothetical protein
MRLEQFLESTCRNAWIAEPAINVYVRKGLRGLADGSGIALDIANIEVELNSQHKGVFKRWLMNAEKLAVQSCEYIFIENVHNPVLPDFLLRVGYMPYLFAPNCYIKKIQ